MTTTLSFRIDVITTKAAAAGDTTNYAIAQRTGVRESTIFRLLAGRTTPTVATLAAIADAYGTTLDDLVQRTGSPAAAIPTQRTQAAA